MGREENIEIFTDTMNICKNNTIVQTNIKNSISNQQIILEKDTVPDGSKIKRFETPAKIIISRKRSLEAAQAYDSSNKICVMNFASATNPGGGVEKGSRAQEECLCRCSTLFPCLKDKTAWETYYKPHRIMNNPVHNDDIIYTPKITVIKTDTSYPKLMSENKWYTVDIISCAAPNLRENPTNTFNDCDGDKQIFLSNEEQKNLHSKRDKRIFDVAVQNKVDVLILGAFGCGAFRNNPKVVSKVMISLAKEYQYAFKVIEFAIYCKPHEDSRNYLEFIHESEKINKI